MRCGSTAVARQVHEHATMSCEGASEPSRCADTRGTAPVRKRGHTCCRPSAASASTARCAAGLAPAAGAAPLPLPLPLPPAAAPGGFAAAPAEGADADLGLAGGALLHMLLSALPPAAFLPGATLAGAPLPGAALAGAPFLGEVPAGPAPALPLAAGAASAPGARAALPGLVPALGGAAGALWPALRPPAPPRDSSRLCARTWAHGHGWRATCQHHANPPCAGRQTFCGTCTGLSRLAARGVCTSKLGNPSASKTLRRRGAPAAMLCILSTVLLPPCVGGAEAAQPSAAAAASAAAATLLRTRSGSRAAWDSAHDVFGRLLHSECP
jgi:hypothetical protein